MKQPFKMSSQSFYLFIAKSFNPITTGCCHMTLIYGLIPPMAGRNTVKEKKLTLCSVYVCATRIPTQQRIRPNNNVSFLSVLSWISIPPNSICHVVLRSHQQTGVHRGPVHWCAPCAVRTSDEGKIEKLAVITIISRDGGRYTYFLMDIEDKLGTKTFRIVYREYAMPEGI